MKKILVLAAMLAVTMVSRANGDILLSENFDYPDGRLVGQGGWANHSGTGTFINVNSGSIGLAQGGGSREDANVALGRTMAAGDIWRFAFDVTVNGTAAATDVYFAHFKDDGTGFNARVFVAAPTQGGNFTFGISEGQQGESIVKFSTDFNYGTTYRVFAEYNFDTGNSSLWINDPSTVITSTGADIGQAMSAFAFRQAAGNTSMVIDNLVVTAVPEPSALLLVGSVLGAGFLRRRRS